MKLPIPFSTMAYDLARAVIFRDNRHRMAAFEAPFAEVEATDRIGDYLEFGVARGTSLISESKIARR